MSTGSYMPDMDAAMLTLNNQDLVQQKIKIDALNKNLNPGKTEAQLLRESCEGFESIFIQKMWEQMRKTVPQDGLLHSKQEESYMSMFDYEFSRKMSDAGGIGLADMMYEQLSQKLLQQGKLPDPSAGPALPIVPATNSLMGSKRFADEQPLKAELAAKPALKPLTTAENLYEEMRSNNDPHSEALAQSANSDLMDFEAYSQALLQAELAQSTQNVDLNTALVANSAVIAENTATNDLSKIHSAVPVTTPGVPIIRPETPSKPEVIIDAPTTANGEALSGPQSILTANSNIKTSVSTAPSNAPAEKNVSLIVAAKNELSPEVVQSINNGSWNAANNQKSTTPSNLSTTKTDAYVASASAIYSSDADMYSEAPLDGPVINSVQTPEMATLNAALSSAQRNMENYSIPTNEPMLQVNSVSSQFRHSSILELPSYNLPVSGPAIKAFGWSNTETGERVWHQGVDYASPAGSNIHAAMDGEIVFAGEREGYGNLVIVQHKDGWRTYYGNASLNGYKNGDTVKAGTNFARLEAKGEENASHMHFELRRGELALNPSGSILYTAERWKN